MPDDPQPADESTPGPGGVERVKAALVTARERAAATRADLEARREHQPAIDVAFCTMERDLERGGGLIAGALAYRFFFWLLPFVLVVAGGLGFLASVDDANPQELAKSLGVFGFAAQAVVQAGEDGGGHTHLWALGIGLPALYFASLSFVKALRVGHALIWGVPNPKLTRKPVAALATIGVLTLTLGCVALESAVRERSGGLGLTVALLFTVVIAGLWLFVTAHMPRPPGTTWVDLIPGALATALGAQIVHLVTVYYVSRKVSGASASYGALGASAGILLSLFFLARVAVGGAELTAVMWHRRQPPVSPGSSPSLPRTPPA